MVQDNKRNRFDNSDDGDEVKRKPQGLQSMIMQALPAVVISLVLMFAYIAVMVLPKYVTKTDDTANIQGILSSITTLKNAVDAFPASNANDVNSLKTQVAQITDQLNGLNTSISNLSNSMTNYEDKSAYTTDLNAIKTDINNLKNSVVGVQSNTVNLNALQNSLNDLGNKLATLQSNFTSLSANVSALKTAIATPTPTTPAQAITTSVKTMSGALFPTSNTTLTASFRVQLTNTTNKDISDIVLGIQVQTSGIASVGIPVYTLAGGNANWQVQGYNAIGAYFINANWGLTVKAQQTMTLYLTLTVTNSAGGYLQPYYLQSGIPYQIDVQVQ